MVSQDRSAHWGSGEHGRLWIKTQLDAPTAAVASAFIARKIGLDRTRQAGVGIREVDDGSPPLCAQILARGQIGNAENSPIHTN